MIIRTFLDASRVTAVPLIHSSLRSILPVLFSEMSIVERLTALY